MLTQSKRSFSESDLTAADLGRRPKRTRTARNSVILVRTSDGSSFLLDVSRDGHFASRFPHSHLIALGQRTGDDGDNRSDGCVDDTSHGLSADSGPFCHHIVLPSVDRTAFAPLYAYVALASGPPGSRASRTINSLVASTLVQCLDRMDDVDAAADALGVPDASRTLRSWIAAAMPHITGDADPHIVVTNYGFDVNYLFEPTDLTPLQHSLGVSGAEQFCARVSHWRLGAERSPLTRHLVLDRFDTLPYLDRAQRVQSFGKTLRGWLPFLEATASQPCVDGAYERAHAELSRHDGALQRCMDDLSHLAKDMPSRVHIDNPYHIMAAIFCRLRGPSARFGTQAIRAAANKDVGLLGLLMDAASRLAPAVGAANNAPRIEALLADHYLGDLNLGPHRLYCIDGVISLYYREHDIFCRHYAAPVIDPATS
jgi:hypothetical protein